MARPSTVVDGKKPCPRCGKLLPVSEYGVRYQKGILRYQSYCRPCSVDRTQEWFDKPENYQKHLKRQQLRNRQKLYARNKVHAAIKAGKLKRQVCERCGSEKVEAHHADYEKPLEVRWLCKPHHAEHHREVRISTISPTGE